MRTSLFSRRNIRQGALLAIGSAKIKLMLASCILFTLIVLAGRTTSIIGWKQHAVSRPRSSLPRRGYTLLINTWKRNDLLKASISHYASCPGLDSVHIVWSEPDPPSESLISFLSHAIKSNSEDSHKIELKFDINKEDSLNNRFKEINDLKSDLVFSIDDDIIFPCTTVEFAFNVWQSAPDTMVGFVPRVHWVNKLKDSQKYFYSGWWSVWWTGTYSIILSKAAFFHKKYLAMYTYEMPSTIQEYVTKNRNCEDIAMSFLVLYKNANPANWHGILPVPGHHLLLASFPTPHVSRQHHPASLFPALPPATWLLPASTRTSSTPACKPPPNSTFKLSTPLGKVKLLPILPLNAISSLLLQLAQTILPFPSMSRRQTLSPGGGKFNCVVQQQIWQRRSIRGLLHRQFD